MNEQPDSGVRQLDSEYVYFLSPAKPAPGEAAPHAFMDYLFPRKKEEVMQDWTVTINQTVELVSQNVDKAPEGYKMDEIEVSLGFSAKGQLAFIAEAGVQAAVRIVFRRQP